MSFLLPFPLHRTCAALLIVAALVLSGCATTTPTRTGFLPSYTSLQPIEGSAKDEARLLVSTAQYREVVIAPVQLRFDAKQAGLSPEQAEVVRATAQKEFARALAAHFTVITPTGKAPALELRAAITRVDTSNAVVNAITTVALLVPVNNGGVCVEWQALDVATGAVVAEGVSVATGKPWQLTAAFEKTGHARAGLGKVADNVANYLRLPSKTPAAEGSSL